MGIGKLCVKSKSAWSCYQIQQENVTILWWKSIWGISRAMSLNEIGEMLKTILVVHWADHNPKQNISDVRGETTSLRHHKSCSFTSTSWWRLWIGSHQVSWRHLQDSRRLSTSFVENTVQDKHSQRTYLSAACFDLLRDDYRWHQTLEISHLSIFSLTVKLSGGNG
jgi:hypothetical protein